VRDNSRDALGCFAFLMAVFYPTVGVALWFRNFTRMVFAVGRFTKTLRFLTSLIMLTINEEKSAPAAVTIGKATIYDQKQMENCRPKVQRVAEGVLVGPGVGTLFHAGRIGPVGQANKRTETGVRCNCMGACPE